MTVATETAYRSDMTVAVDVAARRAAVSGCLDMSTAPLLVETLSALLHFGEGDIILDLGSVTFLDAAGMSSFVQVVNRLRPAGRRLIIEAVPERLGRLLVLAGLGFLVGRPTSRAHLAAVHSAPSGKRNRARESGHIWAL